MSFFVWLGRFFNRTPEGHPTSPIFWTANILAAVLFGLGHLPATSVLVPLTLLVIARTVVLNGLLGVIWGWLYWKRAWKPPWSLTFLRTSFYMYWSPYRS